MTEESKGVPVADLSVEQVATLEKQLVSELEFFVESQNQLKVDFFKKFPFLIN